MNYNSPKMANTKSRASEVRRPMCGRCASWAGVIAAAARCASFVAVRLTVETVVEAATGDNDGNEPALGGGVQRNVLLAGRCRNSSMLCPRLSTPWAREKDGGGGDR